MILVKEYRSDVLENVHDGSIAIISTKNNPDGDVIFSTPDADNFTFFRSASKPIQNLVALVNDFHKKYNLSEEEVAILNASHWGSEHHIKTLKSIAKKANINEDDLIMKPAASFSSSAIAKKLNKYDELEPLNGTSRLQHNCSGKHLSLMLSNQELSGSYQRYHLIDSAVQQEIVKLISLISDTNINDIKIGTDGCGVPVFAVPLKNIALSYSRLVNPTSLPAKLQQAINYNLECINLYPEKINDYYNPIYYLNQHPDFVAKDGARGVITIGIKSLKLGIAVKLKDGSTDELFGLIIARILNLIDYPDKELIKTIYNSYETNVINDNDIIVGNLVSDFTF